ncbi:hypothetical protein [Nocardioides speluncae]|uniref:hypothetical protein n=1 Tax=Nocardioides speluncae TaxID=2670337 RepID=UPI000D688E5E|nr:hypothetical protein [Nocardioides speluncae]
MTSRRVLAVLPVLALSMLVACGEETRPEAADPPQKNELTFTKPDGDTFTVVPKKVTCGPSDHYESVQVVKVNDFDKSSILLIDVVPDKVDGETFELPVDAGDEEGAANALLFYSAERAELDVEVSTAQEDSSGTLTIVRAGCDPAMLELDIDAHLDSELNGGTELDVRGHVELGG